MADPVLDGCPACARTCAEAPFDGAGIQTLNLELLRTLRTALRQSHGPEEAEELLFRIGRRWGEHVGGGTRHAGAEARQRIESGLRELAGLGLGRAHVDSFEAEGPLGTIRISGRVQDSIAFDPRHAATPDEREQVCGFTIGYLTGLASQVTGLDLLCAPFACAGVCDPRGCGFEITPAHAGQRHAQQPPERAPSGSARFFLSTLGASLGEGDLSLGDLIENTVDAIVLIDEHDVVRFWNRGAEQMFQFTREEVVGRPVGFILPQDLQESGELAWIRSQLAAKEPVVNFATRRVRKDGTELQIELTRTVLHDRRGRVVGSTAILRDVTAQRRAELELRHRRELALVGELAAKVAHQIKNPMAGIYATVQLLARKVEVEDSRREMFDDVLSEIRRLDEIVKDLLRYARPVAPRKATVELQSFLGDLLQSLDRHPEVHAHRLVLEAPTELCAALDAAQMIQVIENLVLNAAEAMARSGTITLRAYSDDGALCIEAEDTGPGIPAESRERIFEPFFTTKTSGTGLGLAITRKHVEAHGGTIAVHAGANGGALFRLRLPLA
jgi:PAS domain S-box-containing protein